MPGKSTKFHKVLEGLKPWNNPQSSANTSSKPCPSLDIEETLKTDDFSYRNLITHGFPSQPTCIAFDPIQKLLAIGNRFGNIKIFGKSEVEYSLSHPTDAAVVKIIFLVNQGQFLSICQDDIIHLWSMKSRPPEIVQSLQFKRERLTSAYLSLKSNWLYIGTERGNVNFVNISNFSISGYVINWNKAIELSQSSHPGKVVQIAECPTENNKILIGYSLGVLTLWDLKSRQAEARFRYSDNLYGFSWNFEGKNFMTCHSNGILATWSVKQTSSPISVICPHSCNDSVPSENQLYEPIKSVDWVSTQNGEPFVLFCGGGYLTPVSSSKGATVQSFTNPLPSLTVMRGKRLAVMQMDYPVVDFVTLCESPYECDPEEPYAVSVLLKSDLVVIDILSPNYPSFENPYPIDLHTSPVTALHYVSDCPTDYILSLYLTHESQTSRVRESPANIPSGTLPDPDAQADGSVFSTRDWPINGGAWAKNSNQMPDSFSELIITGHADGSIRFWNANGLNLASMSKFRTCRIFRVNKSDCVKQSSANSNTTKKQSEASTPNSTINNHFSSNLVEIEEDPLAIKLIKFCPESRKILLGSLASMILLKFNREDATSEIPFIDVNATFESMPDPPTGQQQVSIDDDAVIMGSPSQPSSPDPKVSQRQVGISSKRSTSQSSHPSHENKDLRVFLQLRTGQKTWKKGYQPELVCRLGVPSLSFELTGANAGSCILPPSQITAIAFNSEFALMAFGNDSGVVVIDYLNCSVVIQLSTNEFYETIRPNKDSSNVSTKNGCDPSSEGAPPRALSITQKSAKNFTEKPDLSLNHDMNKRNHLFPSNSIDEPVITKPDKAPHQSSFRRMNANLTDSLTTNEAMNPPSSPYNHGSSNNTNKPTFVSKNSIVRSELKRAKSQAALSQKFSRTIPGLMNVHAISIDKCDLSSVTSAKEAMGHASTPPYSTSSSISSLEQFGADTVKILEFSVLPLKKRCQITNRNVFIVGTKLGSVFVFELNNLECRNNQLISVSPSGIIFRHMGDLISVSIMKQSGDLYSPPSAKWNSASQSPVGKSSRVAYSNSSGISSATQSSYPSGMANLERKLGSSMVSLKAPDSADMGSSVNNQNSDVRLLVLVSDRQIKVITFPAITLVYKMKMPEKIFLSDVGVCQLNSQAYINTYTSHGHLMLYSLPSLRLLHDTEIPSRDRPILNPYQPTMSFGISHGLFVYMKSPQEIVKASVSNYTSSILENLMPDLLITRPMPEPMKRNFFKSLFSTSVISTVIDKNELFGTEATNKSAQAVVLNQAGKPITSLNERSNDVVSDIGRAKMAALERGEKLGQLDQQTEEMMNQAKAFSKTASALAAKYERKNNRWGF